MDKTEPLELLHEGLASGTVLDLIGAHLDIPPDKRVQSKEQNWTSGAHLDIFLLRRGSSLRIRAGPLELTWKSPSWEKSPAPGSELDQRSLPRYLPPMERVQPQDQSWTSGDHLDISLLRRGSSPRIRAEPLELTWISPSWEEGPAPGSELNLWSSPGYLPAEKRVQPRNKTRPLELTWISPFWEEGPAQEQN